MEKLFRSIETCHINDSPTAYSDMVFEGFEGGTNLLWDLKLNVISGIGPFHWKPQGLSF